MKARADIVDGIRDVLAKLDRPHNTEWYQGALERKLGYRPIKEDVQLGLEYLFKRREAMYYRFRGWAAMPLGEILFRSNTSG